MVKCYYSQNSFHGATSQPEERPASTIHMKNKMKKKKSTTGYNSDVIAFLPISVRNGDNTLLHNVLIHPGLTHVESFSDHL